MRLVGPMFYGGPFTPSGNTFYPFRNLQQPSSYRWPHHQETLYAKKISHHFMFTNLFVKLCTYLFIYIFLRHILPFSLCLSLFYKIFGICTSLYIKIILINKAILQTEKRQRLSTAFDLFRNQKYPKNRKYTGKRQYLQK